MEWRRGRESGRVKRERELGGRGREEYKFIRLGKLNKGRQWMGDTTMYI